MIESTKLGVDWAEVVRLAGTAIVSVEAWKPTELETLWFKATEVAKLGPVSA